jgi:hypothetical protein
MTPNEELLNQLRVASPCSASWDRMEGDDRVRFCSQCRKHVYDLAEMAPDEAVAVIREQEGNLCARLHRRRDSTLLAGNCPIGYRTMRRALLFQVGLITSVFAAIPGFALVAKAMAPESPLWDKEPLRSFAERVGIRRPVVLGFMITPPVPVDDLRNIMPPGGL